MKIKSTLLLASTLLTATLTAQEDYNNWHMKDVVSDKIPGISHPQALKLVEGKKDKPVIVAIIDSGVDTAHVDLKKNFWVNSDEIPGNGIDDDENGFIDDVNGWNFLGGAEGSVNEETLELTREYRKLKAKYDDGKLHDGMDEYDVYIELKEEFEAEFSAASSMNQFFSEFYKIYRDSHKKVAKHLGKKDFTYEEVKSIKTSNAELQDAASLVASLMKDGLDIDQIKDMAEHYKTQVKYNLNVDFDPRDVIGDDPSDMNDSIYGNNDLMGGDASHGTHVAGIVGAIRNNEEGMNGIATNVQLMIVRAVPNGDERDKDVASAIRYAVNNGADVINMSFGKYYSPHSDFVKDAIAYAERNGVIMVHAAGNDSKNIDGEAHFPTKTFETTNQENKYWIEVGATSKNNNKKLVATFSNYGSGTVDIFAPGVDIYSCVPENEYEDNSGTSMAAPVVTGVIALVLNYYPEIERSQVKQIIIDSGLDYSNKKVVKPSEGKGKKAKLGEISNSGKIVNAAAAMQMASEAATL